MNGISTARLQAFFMMGVISMRNPLHEDLEERLREAGIIQPDETFQEWTDQIHREAEAIVEDPHVEPRIQELGRRLEIWSRGEQR